MKRHRQNFVLALVTLAVMGGGVCWWGGFHRQTPAVVHSAPRSQARQVAAAPPLHPVVEQIAREGLQMPYLKFNYVIKEIPNDLAGHDVEALIGFITRPRPDIFSEIEWGSLTNDIQEALSVQTIPNESVARAFIATFRDESRIQLMRDYALQHIGGFAIYLIHTRSARQDTLPPFFDTLTGELIAAAGDSSQPWAGTALNLLDGLLRAAEYRSFDLPGITPERLTALALPVISDTRAPLNARLPALQLASRRGAPEALALARQLIADPDTPLMLIQSSAAVVGAQGAKADLALLETAAATAPRHSLTALQSAIKRLQTL